MRDVKMAWDQDLNTVNHTDGYLVKFPKYEARYEAADVVGIANMIKRFQEIIKTDLDLQPDRSFIALQVDGNEVLLSIYIRETIYSLAVATAEAFDQGMIYDREEDERVWL